MGLAVGLFVCVAIGFDVGVALFSARASLRLARTAAPVQHHTGDCGHEVNGAQRERHEARAIVRTRRRWHAQSKRVDAADDRQREQRETLLHTHSGIVSREQLDATGASSRTISAWLSTGRLERIRRGLYRSPDSFITHGDLLEAWLSAPYSVICLISALEFHGIGTQMAGRVYLAVPRNHRAPQLEYPPIEVHHFPDAIFKHGVQFHSIGGRSVPIYSPEKTIADTLRYERFVGRDVYLEALQYYLKRKDRNLTALLEAARVCKVLTPTQQSVEALVNDYWNY